MYIYIYWSLLLREIKIEMVAGMVEKIPYHRELTVSSLCRVCQSCTAPCKIEIC